MALKESTGDTLKVAESSLNEAELEQYIHSIGERIRAIRTRRGMIRKHLSKHSGVSERYLAQAESGKANLSVSLLWRIARAMEVQLTELLPNASAAPGSPALQMMLARLNAEQQEAALELLKRRFVKSGGQVQGVALVGLRGAGKTRLGSLLADEYKLPFIRLGDVIEEIAQMSIGELFSLGGQHAYRRIERQALEQTIETHPLAVVESGGSLVTESDTYSRLLDNYFTVWVKATAEEHMNRVMDQGDMRPMADNEQAMEDLKLILAEREAEYRMADYILDTSRRKVLDCSLELARCCEEYLQSGESAG
ncbi:MAG: helix-turn-helix transcriptional regulator [Gammaproteobacteria bacterium]|nr:helix-turn-helix transcriptional regulator [Gammaproteobacteria bacterium]